MQTDLKKKFFKGGVKTKAGKGRTVPIHSLIYDFVCQRDSNNLLGCTDNEFRQRMYEKLTELKIDHTSNGKKHTPHDCRHTFSALCELYNVNENDRKRMMGHSFGSDITNAKYGHIYCKINGLWILGKINKMLNCQTKPKLLYYKNGLGFLQVHFLYKNVCKGY